ncbi:Ppx/GppA phosphatase family protein [Arthrobacter crystallopoietes]|uniref:Ppx/GppA phosphatase family protein n=1 Tax=Crystallibacter crystallopoietes TaxID=37928 RepID=UPI001ABDBBE6|nr:Ppx/GppA phosphatase family protein [Arthrobacter crystallopoietes]QTG79364.1 Ppx/GppA family phosphatase [Arthrobacter crystallopoietes]
MSRVGAIDCGTNSIRLLIADIDDDGVLTDVVRLMKVVRLGQGVDATGMLAKEALARTFAAAEEYAGLLQEHGAERLRFVATSATRDAGNRQVFVDGIRERLGVEPEVVTGAEEAELSFTGAASVLATAPGKKVLVVDLGGGSTEFVLGTSEGVQAALSTDMGCVRFTERHLQSDPPTAVEIAAAETDINAYIDAVLADVPLADTDRLVGVAGSITTVTAHALGLTEYQPNTIHGAELDTAKTAAACTSLLSMSRAERAALPYMHPGRVDVIGAGALIWRTINNRVNELTAGRVNGATASEHDILDGIAMSAARG